LGECRINFVVYSLWLRYTSGIAVTMNVLRRTEGFITNMFAYCVAMAADATPSLVTLSPKPSRPQTVDSCLQYEPATGASVIIIRHARAHSFPDGSYSVSFSSMLWTL